MSTFVEASPFFRSALCVAMENMQFHIAQMDLLFRVKYVCPLYNMTHVKSFFSNGARLV